MKKGIVISLTIVVLTILFASCTVSNDNPAAPGGPFDIVGTWTLIDLEGVPEGVSYSSTWNFRSDGTYDGFFYAAGYYDESDEGPYSLNGTTLSIDGIVAETFFGSTIELSVSNNNNSFSFLDVDGDRWTFTREDDESGFDEIEKETVTDIDGNIYQTIKIGTQWWMGENLKATHYRNGDIIPQVTGKTEWANLNNGGYCGYNNDGSNIDSYGLLYNWYAVNDSRGLAPQGWHVPSIEEWGTLVNYLGGFSIAGGKMKEEGTSHWEDPNVGATNESGFTGLPGGYRWDNGTFMSLRILARFYSSTEYYNTRARGRYLYSGDTTINYLQLDKNYGFSIRCVKD